MDKNWIMFLLKNYTTYPYYYLIGTIIFIPDYNLIYIKQPKCGGTTIINLMDKYKIKYFHWVKPVNNPLYINFLNTIDDEYINNCKVITFSRNPYTRIPSAIKYIFGIRNIKIDSDTNYMDIITNKYHHSRLKISDIHHYIPTNLITNNNNIYDDIYKFENFDNDVKLFFSKYLFTDILEKIPKKNQTSNSCDINVDQINDVIKEHFKEEFKLFGYDL